jgi:hypothetical protein
VTGCQMTDIQMAGLLRAPRAAVPPQGVPGQADATAVDAIHLGTALHSRSVLTSFVTYDKRGAAIVGSPSSRHQT